MVGRQREQRRLHSLLNAALAGRGSIAFISGEAGIGKTTLVRNIAALATERGFLVLAGACYDSGTTPAYSPWRDLLCVAAQRTIPLPFLPANDDWIAQAATPEAVVTTLRATLDHLAERSPLLVILEDLHWADPESLAFLRLFARGLRDQKLVLVATYRDAELHSNTALDQTLPHLVREATAERIALHPLDEPAIAALIRQRYELSPADQDRLTASLAGRSQGVPFYLIELLRTLEADQHLRRTMDGWLLGDLDEHLVPVLVKQVIGTRLSGLGNDARRLLELVAVISQEAPLVLLRRLNSLDDEAFAEALDEAMRSQLLVTGTSSLCVQFTHALARDSLYTGIPLSRRQRWHRRIAEALAEDGGHPPDVIAHHFRQALDRRAVDWFIRAGSAVERVAWLTAASHFAAALEMLGPNDGDPQLRGWLLARRAGPLRNTEPRTSLALLATAEALAVETNDAVLHLYVTFLRGQIRCISGDIQRGLVDLETSVGALVGLSPADVERFEELERQGAVASRIEIEGLLAATLASVGRVDEALEGAEDIIRRASVAPVRAWWARAIALALAGRPSEASRAFIACGEALRMAFEASTGATLILYQIMLLQIPYAADDLVERRRIVADGEMAWQYAGGALGEVSQPLIALQYLLLEGEWQTARELAMRGIESADLTSAKHLVSGIVLAQIAREQGETTLAWQLVHRMLPAGPQTAPGHAEFATSRTLMFIATLLCLDAGDIPSARTWLDAHDQWLKWNHTMLGRSENQLLWAHYFRAMGDLPRARHHATEALKLANDPRQPLALLASHRLCGELEVMSGTFTEAHRHLDAALSLATACNALYEHALTLLGLAELRKRAGERDAALEALEAARSIFSRLNATPALSRADTFAAQLASEKGNEPAVGLGLSPREIEVLRLIAKGGRNREIAEELFLSVRTVERHITNLYAKLGVNGRAEAIAFAHTHDIS
jgi:ATP/maltotriose-dependent transcriptional regulator MalT